MWRRVLDACDGRTGCSDTRLGKKAALLNLFARSADRIRARLAPGKSTGEVSSWSTWRCRILAITAIAAVFVFAWCVWPTLYRYDHTKIGDDRVVVRMHRFSGKAEYLAKEGWIETSTRGTARTTGSRRTMISLPADLITSLRAESNAHISGSTMAGKMYNPSEDVQIGNLLVIEKVMLHLPMSRCGYA